MNREVSAPVLSAIFIDYDNIYLSLRRKNEDAAKRFSKDAGLWLRAIEEGRLVSANRPVMDNSPRRIVSIRCYGNPAPRRNPHDNTTDMNSFSFVRHNFLRAGCEVIDCPPLTNQQKNAADIRMVMDLRDYLTHPTYFDEFIILSADADFTPVLHRLRQHARRTVIYTNDHMAAAYMAICDGEVRETDLISLLLEGQPQIEQRPPVPAAVVAPAQSAAPHAAQLRIEDLRQMIMGEVVAGVRAASGPVPLEALADRAIRAIGHERTVGTAWAGTGSFRELMRIGLPTDLRLTEHPPFYAFDPQRHGQTAQPTEPAAPAPQMADVAPTRLEPVATVPVEQRMAPPPRLARQPQIATALAQAPVQQSMVQQAAQPGPAQQSVAPPAPSARPSAMSPAALSTRPASSEPVLHRAAAQKTPIAQQPQRMDQATAVQAVIARVHEACQAPPLGPQEYRAVFEAAAAEINDNGLAGAQTLTAIVERVGVRGANVRREDVRFVLDVVSESDPWFENGATANLFAGRFRNFVVSRCRDQGLTLSASELDLIDAWFTGSPMPDLTEQRVQPTAVVRRPAETPPSVPPQPAQRQIAAPAAQPATAPRDAGRDAPREAPRESGTRWWSLEEGRQYVAERNASAAAAAASEDDLPRIVRTRRG